MNVLPVFIATKAEPCAWLSVWHERITASLSACSRNAGKRYDLVVAGMAVIGLIGLILDRLVRRLEKFDEVSWGYGPR